MEKKEFEKEVEKLEKEKIEEWGEGKKELEKMRNFGKEVEGGYVLTLEQMLRYLEDAKKRK